MLYKTSQLQPRLTAIIGAVKLRFDGKKHETANIWSFHFIPQDIISWQAGQSIRLEVPRASYGYNERRFTIASLPSSGYMKITTRISNSEFKRDLDRLETGAVIDAYNIEGGLNWGDELASDKPKPKVFIAGGTGITLFYIAILDRLERRLGFDIHLLYSSREQSKLFWDFFTTLADQDKLKLVHSDQRFSAQFINDYLKGLPEYDLHIAGPDNMVFSLKSQLADLGIDSARLASNFLV